MRILSAGMVLLVFLLGSSCNNDDDQAVAEEEQEEIVDDSDDNDDQGEDEVDDDDNSDSEGPVLINNTDLRQEGYVLVNDPGSVRAYIMDKDSGEPVFEWELPFRLGNDAKLLDNGELMVSLRAEDPDFSFGGFGGMIHFLQPDGNSSWEIDLSNSDFISHHDVIMLPNGNVMTMLWERVLPDDAPELGYRGVQDTIFTESIVEINPATDEIVWKWDSRDHLIQEADETGNNYGDISQNPQLIDVNYRDTEVPTIPNNGDFMHANALAYDAINDVILMSVNYFSEIWFIDHSTSTEEASGSEGGNFNRGGDLVYRMGNPSAYQNTQGSRLFYNNHNPRFVPGTDHILVFMNGNNTEGPSVVYELDLPDQYRLTPDADNEPVVVWEYTDPEMYSDLVSGAERLPNGNTLIAIGTFGYWEVTDSGEIVWQFQDEGFFWRGYHIDTDDPVLGILGIE